MGQKEEGLSETIRISEPKAQDFFAVQRRIGKTGRNQT